MLLRFNYYLTFKSGNFSWFVVVLRLFLLTKGSQNNILWAQKKFVRYFVWVGDVENYDSCTQCNKCSVLFWHKHKFKSKQKLVHNGAKAFIDFLYFILLRFIEKSSISLNFSNEISREIVIMYEFICNSEIYT